MTSPERDLDFACALVATAAGGAETNFVCSPWSVATTLAMLAAGSDAAARGEIEAAIGPVDHLRSSAGLVTADPATQESVLAVANRVWADERAMVEMDFVDSLMGWPGAAVRTAPLRRDTEAARVTINSDVASTTRGLIPEIVARGMLDPDDRAVVVNALYLLSGWRQPFHPGATVAEPFACPAGSRPVATMRQSVETLYAASGGWAWLSLELGLGLDAEVLLPPGGTRGAPGVPLQELRAAAAAHRVDLHLPRVRVESGTELSVPLMARGVRRIFDPAAAAVRGVVDEPVWVSEAIHRAVLRMDEAGIEAAAATALRLTGVAYRRLPEVEMVVDRPFWLLVTHRATGSILFMARVVDP